MLQEGSSRRLSVSNKQKRKDPQTPTSTSHIIGGSGSGSGGSDSKIIIGRNKINTNTTPRIEIMEVDKVTSFITNESINDFNDTNVNVNININVDDVNDINDVNNINTNNTSIRGNKNFRTMTSPLSSTRNERKNFKNSSTTQSSKRRSSQDAQERLWEKEKLHEINLRVDNIFNTLGNKIDRKGGSIRPAIVEGMRSQQDQIIQELTEKFSDKDRQKENELSEFLEENDNLKNRYTELNSELQHSHAVIEQLRMDLENAKKEKEDALREKSTTTEEVQNLKDALETQLKMLQGDMEGIYIPLGNIPADIKDELEKKLAARLADLLQDRDDQNNKLKQQLENELQKKIDALEHNYNAKIVNLTNRDEMKKKQLEELKTDTLQLVQDRDQFKSELETKKNVHEMMENELKKQIDNSNEELKSTQDKLGQAKKEQQTTNNLYFELEKSNLHLRNEIESLKRKLDAFEEEHRIESPVRPAKRRRTDSSLMEPKILQSVQGPLVEPYSTFPLECVTIQYEGDWAGFELQNQWNKSVILKGWSLTSEDPSLRLQLPEKILIPREIIRVCLTKNKKEGSDLLWQDLEIQKNEPHELWAEDNLGHRHKITNFPLPPATTGFRTESCLLM